MGEQRRKFTKEFKLEAVRLVVEGGHSVAQVARDLDLSEGVLHRWKRQFEEHGDNAFPGMGRLLPQDDEMRQMRREMERLRQERDILKKALAICSQTKR